MTSMRQSATCPNQWSKTRVERRGKVGDNGDVPTFLPLDAVLRVPSDSAFEEGAPTWHASAQLAGHS